MSRKSVLCLDLELKLLAQDHGSTHGCDELFKDRFLNQPFLTNIALQQNVSLSKSWNEKAFPFLSVSSGVFPCANYKVIFLTAPGKWVLLSQSSCLTALLYPPKNQKPLFLMLAPSIGNPNFNPHSTGPQVGSCGLWVHGKCWCQWESAAGSLCFLSPASLQILCVLFYQTRQEGIDLACTL